MKKLTLSIIGLILFSYTIAGTSQQLGLVIVDQTEIQQTFDLNAVKMKYVKHRLPSEISELKKLRQEIAKLEKQRSNKITESSNLIKPSSELQAKRKRYHQLNIEYQQKAKVLNQEADTYIKNTIAKHIAEVATSKHYTVVLNKASLAYSQKQINITNEVIASLEKIFPKHITTTKHNNVIMRPKMP